MSDRKIDVQLGGTLTVAIGFIDLLVFFAFLNILAPGTPLYLVTVAQFLFAVGWTVLIGILIVVGLLVLFFIIAVIVG